MLADDPLNAAALRNLAVTHASAGDLGAATQAWSHYVETLYLQDLLAGDPHRGAAHRAEVHRILAGSFGTAVLVARTTRDAGNREDVRDMPPALASRAKVATAVAHLRLEELNRALSYRSPTLLLGVGRSIAEAELATARDRRLAAAEAATAALSPRIRGPFTDLCRQAIENAHQAASVPGGRIRRPTDETEEEAHSAWVKERILWKQRISEAVTDKDADWPLTEYSGDVIGNLQLIDDLPLDPHDEFIRRSVQQRAFRGTRRTSWNGTTSCPTWPAGSPSARSWTPRSGTPARSPASSAEPAGPGPAIRSLMTISSVSTTRTSFTTRP